MKQEKRGISSLVRWVNKLKWNKFTDLTLEYLDVLHIHGIENKGTPQGRIHSIYVGLNIISGMY